ncbi:hypothetical protein BDF14DRAFT_1856054 [Spinellus fusiger]|nr:hypothetical protein BDF14DRAFT_1856054 [Spinellus fusiger]
MVDRSTLHRGHYDVLHQQSSQPTNPSVFLFLFFFFFSFFILIILYNSFSLSLSHTLKYTLLVHFYLVIYHQFYLHSLPLFFLMLYFRKTHSNIFYLFYYLSSHKNTRFNNRELCFMFFLLHVKSINNNNKKVDLHHGPWSKEWSGSTMNVLML